MDPAFEGAGTEPGLMIWRIEDFNVVPYPAEKYGQFYQGDSYIVLHTEQSSSGSFSWDIHFWLGSETTQDEAGTAAIKSVELDCQLGGTPVQHREVEAHESALFLSRFKKGIRYLKGGVKSGFHHVDPDAPYLARLFKVKGRRNVRVTQVDVDIAGMNKGDCFILDAGKAVYVYMGPKSRRIERMKAIMAANGIRDDDHAGGSKVIIIDETASQGEMAVFLEALGAVDLQSIPDEGDVEEDAEHERSEVKSVTLHRIWENDEGLIENELVSGPPLLQSMLNSDEGDSQDCFLLDTGGSGVFVWIGRTSSKKEKVRSMEMAKGYLSRKGYPAWTKVERVIERGEPTAFKQYFKTWKVPEDQIFLGRPYTVEQIAAFLPEPDFDVSSLHRKKMLTKNATSAFGFMPDDGSGQIDIFRVENFELIPVDESCHGFFFGGDSYVIKYTYEKDGRQGYIIYFWQGIASSQDEKAASAIEAVKMDNDLNGKAVQVRVVQGHEPEHFLRMFRGRLVLFIGGKASGFRNVHDHDTYDVDGTRLFQVRGLCDFDTRAIQRPEVAASLHSDDVFVLETPLKTFLWVGSGASDEEKAMGENVAALVSPGRDLEVVAEGEEGEDFWAGLGGQGEYPKGRSMDKPLLASRLFHCSISPAGRLRVKEVSNYSQEDLIEDDVMILDSGDEVYVWIGSKSSDEEKEKGLSIAEEYVKSDPTERDLSNAIIMRINQGTEPAAFISLFPAWNPNMWEELPTYEDLKSKVAKANLALE